VTCPSNDTDGKFHFGIAVLPLGSSRKTVAEYQEFAAKCREMAARMTDPQDRRAPELQTSAWEKVANAREAALQRMSRRNSRSGPQSLLGTVLYPDGEADWAAKCDHCAPLLAA
jgi:hypothetical protein